MTKITHLSQLDLNKSYNYADYLTWQLDEMVELIKGKISLMSPAPNVNHQRIERNLIIDIGSYLRGKKCQIFPAPFDVRLYDRKKSLLASQDIYSVVQPDVCVVCNPDFLDKQGCNGAPDWIIEILSKGNSKKETQVKFALYQESGVHEYWIVYPNDFAIHQFILDENKNYQLNAMFTDDDVITPSFFPDLKLDLTQIFESFD
ncbi:MAG: Uma2 family endonuclease [Methylococcales bacterium]|nr:Uma2 family endonuclease [Methylococcales bacterium]